VVVLLAQQQTLKVETVVVAEVLLLGIVVVLFLEDKQ
jgi:hypothetical protein